MLFKLFLLQVNEDGLKCEFHVAYVCLNNQKRNKNNNKTQGELLKFIVTAHVSHILIYIQVNANRIISSN